MTDTQKRQLVVIGAGPGGYVAAIRAAQLGIQTTVVERGNVGGACLNVGCIPTKTLLHTAEVYEQARNSAEIGVVVDGAALDYDALRARVDQVRSTMRGGVEQLLDANGIELVRGSACVAGPERIEIALNEGGSAVYAADDIIVATGSRPAMAPIEGIDTPGILTSDDMLGCPPQLESLVIIGGGVIGVELASAYSALGCKVTVLEQYTLLPAMDREFGQSLAMSMRKRGVNVVVNASVDSIRREEDGAWTVGYSTKKGAAETSAQAVLVATSRKAVLDGLFADGCAPNTERGRIVVDAQMRTSIPHVYAIGDAAFAGAQLAHAASAQGKVAVEAIAGLDASFDADMVPSCVYTSPEIASVGLTEAAAKERGIEARSVKFPMGGNGKSLITKQDRSFIKVVVDADGRVIGGHMMCGRASDMIGELSVAVANGLTVDQMLKAVRPHPTFEEAMGEAFEACGDGAIHAMPRRKR